MRKNVRVDQSVLVDTVTIASVRVRHHSSDMEKFVQITQNVVRIFVCRMLQWEWLLIRQHIVYKKMELPVRVHNIVLNPVLMVYVLMDRHDLLV